MGNCLTQALKTAVEVAETLQQQDQQQQAAAGGGGGGGGGGGSDSGSAVHSSLPAGAEQATVRNVYDGDTLTLTDERRVRFLGIDTPEVKENQPFSQEAKEYTKSRCNKQEIWLTYDGDKEDHYGRLLAFVWVKTDGGYLNVNEGIVEAGLAGVYAPNASSKTSNYDKMIGLQKAARDSGAGMWANFKNKTVVKTSHGAAFHVRSCEHLSNSRNLEELSEAEAMDKGLHACRTCLS